MEEENELPPLKQMHKTMDLIGVPSNVFPLLFSKERWSNLEKIIADLIDEMGVTVLQKVSYHFRGYDGAMTALFLLCESHFSIHTYPEYKYIAIDLFTCGSSDSTDLLMRLIDIIKPEKYIINTISRNAI
jgi:S-adenosylmethionine decarboxylase proenzyme